MITTGKIISISICGREIPVGDVEIHIDVPDSDRPLELSDLNIGIAFEVVNPKMIVKTGSGREIAIPFGDQFFVDGRKN